MQLAWDSVLVLAAVLATRAENPVTPPVVGETTLKGKKVPWAEAPTTQVTARDPLHAVTDSITIAGQKFPATIADGRLHLSTVPDGAATSVVAPGGTTTLTWTDDGGKRSVALRFVADDKGAWHYYAVNGWEYKIGGELLRLVDADADGKYDGWSSDGCTTYDSTVMLPLRKDFVLGSNHIQLSSLSADGATLVVTVEPIKVNPPELAALVRLNHWRSASGLTSVSFDSKLSRDCTAHAAYLRLHNWSGNTNPHSEDPGAPGTSPEGQSAAKRSVICKGPVAVTLESFLTTYYHRAPLMSPGLEHIGLNEKPEDITVIDVSEGLDKPWPTVEGWACPAITPGPGARGVTLTAMTEQPHEPVDAFGSRGLPLLVLFEEHGKEVKDFRGKLFERTKSKLIEVPALPADPWEYQYIQGIVPASKLKAKTHYHAEFTFALGGKAQVREVDFDTE